MILSQYSKDNNLKREVIMDYYSTPKLKSKLESTDIDHFSTQCVDEIHIKWDFENGKLTKVNWDGVGCAVCLSSTDMFLEKTLNKSKDEILELAYQYENMINQNGQPYDENLLEKLLVYSNVKSQLNRLYCANMISQAIIKTLEG